MNTYNFISGLDNTATRNNDGVTTERALQNHSSNKPEFHHTPMAYQDISPAGKEIETANDTSLTNEDSRNNNQSSTTSRDGGIEKKMEHAQLPEDQPTVTKVMEKNLSLGSKFNAHKRMLGICYLYILCRVFIKF